LLNDRFFFPDELMNIHTHRERERERERENGHRVCSRRLREAALAVVLVRRDFDDFGRVAVVGA
jgi:hypothetical protein